jgi:predicted RNase H-like nuclease
MKSNLGVDGCPSGWAAVKILEDNTVSFYLYENIHILWSDNKDAELILIDIPIGLPRYGDNARECDVEARRLLKPYRASSVYPVPCREALYANDYRQANELNKELTGKGLSKQSWMISPKIREVDSFLLSNHDARNKVREIHPEVLFWALNGGQPMRHNKRTEAGFHERVGVIGRFDKNYADIFRGYRRIDFNISVISRLQYSRDDIVDAFVAALTARLSEGKLQTIPIDPVHDGNGLTMQMVYWRGGSY